MNPYHPGSPAWYEHEIRELKKKNESLELVASCARDIIALWPQFSFRMVRIMCSKMDTLKEALEMSSKTGQ